MLIRTTDNNGQIARHTREIDEIESDVLRIPGIGEWDIGETCAKGMGAAEVIKNFGLPATNAIRPTKQIGANRISTWISGD